MLELAPDVLAFLFVVAVAAGFIDAIAGGGGLITVPALLAVGVPPVAAIATNKVQGSFGTAAATWTFWRKGRIDFALLKWPLLATVAGAILGAVAVTFVDTDWL
ncbi:TSUP family transporter, partial [Brevundimonas sp.]|uniref:TSUP family transporter n=2 Tax=Brevundimonas TaxID=41275 RepID=UPI0028AB80CF